MARKRQQAGRGLVSLEVAGEPLVVMVREFRDAIRVELERHNHGELPHDTLADLGREWLAGSGMTMAHLREFVDAVRIKRTD